MEKPLPENSRRQFLGNLSAALAALSIPAALAAAQAATGVMVWRIWRQARIRLPRISGFFTRLALYRYQL